MSWIAIGNENDAAMPVMLGSLLNCSDWEVEGGTAPEELNME